jgi:cytochrome c oxidase subunit III
VARTPTVTIRRVTGGAVVTEPGVRRPSPLAVGTIVWLASELMFFGGLFASYFTIRGATEVWPPAGVHLNAVRAGFFTLVLVASSGTMQLGARELEHDDRRAARGWILLTIGLGSIFLLNQYLEWTGLSFSVSTDAYGSLFYLMTGFHGLHVVLGQVGMVGLLVRIAGPGPDPGDRYAVQAVTYYWHFVDVVWVALYVTLYIVR